MKTLTINGKTYPAKEITFNFLCSLEDAGVSIDDIDRKPMKIAREYFAYCGSMSSEDAGKEIEAHVVGGNNLATLYEVLSEAMETSDFFLAIGKNSETTEEPAQKETRKKK